MSGGSANSERATTGQNSTTDGNTVDRVNGWLSFIVPSMQRKITKLNYDLIEECKRCKEDSNLSKSIRDELESYCRDIRREVVKKARNGCAPLFIACKRGCVPIAEYLVTVCEADIEQRGLYEVPEDHTFHYVTPLWCAVVSGKLPMVKYLIRIGCDINATSDSGSTPVRSACFMTHVEIVQYLVEAGADIQKPNINGGTCLINSVQSPQLCLYLLKKGADVNAKDIQEKTALHYAIQEHRLETTKLLLEHGADPYVKSRYGDDAMRTACIKGASQIFDYLKTHLEYSSERLAEAHELIGSTYLDEHNETRVAILHWRLAHHIRASHTPYLQKLPRVPLRPAYGNAIEFTTLEELDNIATDVDAMRIQSLLICERILGLTHKDMLFRLTFRGASYADSLQLQRCIDLWRLLLEVRVTHFSILHFDTCYAAQTLVRLMIDLHERYLRNVELEHREVDIREFFGEEFEDDVGKDEHLPVFEDVIGVFRLLSGTVAEAQQLLQIRPVYRKQQENFDRILKCIAHLIYLLLGTSDTADKRKDVYYAVYDLVHTRVRSACTYDTLLHLCVSRLNVIKSGYLSDENHLNIVFPNDMVVKLLLDCGMNVNAKNEAKSTALHVAVQPYNYSNRIIHLLLERGADLDQPNKSDERPFNLIAGNPINTIPLINYMNLRCMAATVIMAIEDEEDGPYRGKYLGKINSYHHQVSGDVYAVNEYTFLIIGFNYDGNGADTFFWAGASNRPGPQGFIVPDEYGKTNILDRYHNKDFTLSLPDRKKITEIKWLAVYDLNNQNNFGDVYIPEEFEPPRAQAGGTFSRRSHNVSSSALEMLDSKTIRIKDFTYDGLGKRTFFWTGVGAQPSSRGSKIPDEMGYLDPIRKYEKETITLELPGDKTIFDIDWISIYDLADNENFGHILIADNLNVPPSLVKITPYEFSLPNCRQLHKNLQVSWEVFGPQITLQLSGQVEKNDYMSFGISGSETSSQMIGADVVVAYIDDIRGYSVDYNITSLAPCVQVLGQNKGVCRDDVVGGLDSFQLNTYSRKDGINTITFRRTLISSDSGDKEIRLDKSNYVVWALGELDSNSEPAFHFVYPKSDILIDFNTTEPINDCFSFTKAPEAPIQIWDRVRLHDPTLRTFNAYLGPSGGLRGYQGITGHVSSGLAWYINGYMTPELYLKRGLTYAFKVRGGNNPHSPEHYHPMVITDEPHGGFDRLSDAKQSEIRVLAGVEFTRRGRPKPTAAGPLCLSKYPLSYDRRLDDNFPSFKKFNRSLISICPNEDPAILEITPNITWPDTVYYNSFTHANMGWKIHIVDSFTNLRNGALQNAVMLPAHLGLILLCLKICIKLIRDQ